ncbi:MAG: AmmeMemoRadiSam system protein B [Phycisphaerales bacterium]|jgi:hypothetical protein|nr:AmmeMemoRadiSam system protein B [Phycisphaerales bacterium]
MPFSDLPDHLSAPAIRNIHPVPVKQGETKMLALTDPYRLAAETVVVPPQVFQIVRLFDGEQSLEAITSSTGAPPDKILSLVEKLDQVGLIWGPTADRLEAETLARFHEAGAFPVRSSGSLGEDADACKAQLDSWFDETEDPELEHDATAIVAPHLDYDRGWPNYASAYFPWRGAEAPDRIVILGTNHFGHGDGVVMTDIATESPLGRCEIDRQVVEAVAAELGRGALVDQIDHVPEHSIELHIPWIQHCFGNVPIVAALIPSPLVEMLKDDGARVSTDDFVASLGNALAAAGGTTRFVASADLSHVGKQFGEPRPVDDQRRFDVERHDREMMSKYIAGDAEEFVQAMRWNNNATQWCSIGNMAATMQLCQPETIELVDYRQACDDQGQVMVSSCAMAMW